MADVLLLEDNAELLNILREAVEYAGHSVRIARSAEEGLEVLNNFRPQVIVCDLILGDMDGGDFVHQLRLNPDWSDVYIVAMSGQDEGRRRALASGANDFLAKPFSIHELNALLERFTHTP